MSLSFKTMRKYSLSYLTKFKNILIPVIISLAIFSFFGASKLRSPTDLKQQKETILNDIYFLIEKGSHIRDKIDLEYKSKQPPTKSWGLWNTLALKCSRQSPPLSTVISPSIFSPS